MEKPTKEELTQWLESGKNGKVMKAYLAQEEELEKERNFVEAHRLLVQELKAENRALKATIETIRMNIKNTPIGHEKFKLDCIKNFIGVQP